jgi:ribA/ribD-fused uncharacterized protein
MVARDALLFYEPRGPNGWLSTFSPHSLVLHKCRWRTVEHYFQSQKFLGPELKKWIRTAPTALEAKLRAERLRHLRRPDWRDVRDQVMLRAVRAKFRQHPGLARKLRATRSRQIVENSEGNSYWGRGSDFSGRNRLGQLIMKVRKELEPL